MPISLNEFVQSLTDTGILPAEELSSIVGSFHHDRRGVDVETLAKELVRQQKLTEFQATVIFRRQSRGLRIGDYLLRDKLGSGAMGQVFRAENRRTGELVALKLLRASFSKSEKAVARFYREASTASRLKHPNLVSVGDAGEWSGLHYLVMELIDGRDIRSIIKEGGPLSVSSAINVVLQAARGLEYAHQNGIVHRDIKPANLLLDKSGRRVVILDLGLARLDEAATDDDTDGGGRLTMPGHFVGTLEYASPEQAVDAHEVDGRTDIYSLGCTLYYLLKARPPYRRENTALILLAHCQDPIPKLQTVPGVTERLDLLFRRMLAKKVENRVSTMSEVIAELEACRREIKQAGKPGGTTPRPTEPTPAAHPAAASKPQAAAPAPIEQMPAVDDTQSSVVRLPSDAQQTPEPAQEFDTFEPDVFPAAPDAPHAPNTTEEPADVEDAQTEAAPWLRLHRFQRSHKWWAIVGTSVAVVAITACAWFAGWL